MRVEPAGACRTACVASASALLRAASARPTAMPTVLAIISSRRLDGEALRSGPEEDWAACFSRATTVSMPTAGGSSVRRGGGSIAGEGGRGGGDGGGCSGGGGGGSGGEWLSLMGGERSGAGTITGGGGGGAFTVPSVTPTSSLTRGFILSSVTPSSSVTRGLARATRGEMAGARWSGEGGGGPGGRGDIFGDLTVIVTVIVGATAVVIRSGERNVRCGEPGRC